MNLRDLGIPFSVKKKSNSSRKNRGQKCLSECKRGGAPANTSQSGLAKWLEPKSHLAMATDKKGKVDSKKGNSKRAQNTNTFSWKAIANECTCMSRDCRSNWGIWDAVKQIRGNLEYAEDERAENLKQLVAKHFIFIFYFLKQSITRASKWRCFQPSLEAFCLSEILFKSFN